MKIKGTVKTVRSKPVAADKADITFKVETPYTQEASDAADLLCPDDCLVTLRPGFDFQARLVHVESDTNNRVVPGPDGSTRTVDRQKVLTLSFSMPHSVTIFRHMWAAHAAEFEEIDIRQFQADMFEGAGAQASAEREGGTADGDDETDGDASETGFASDETNAGDETTGAAKDPLEDVGYTRRPRRGMAVVEGGA